MRELFFIILFQVRSESPMAENRNMTWIMRRLTGKSRKSLPNTNQQGEVILNEGYERYIGVPDYYNQKVRLIIKQILGDVVGGGLRFKYLIHFL